MCLARIRSKEHRARASCPLQRRRFVRGRSMAARGGRGLLPATNHGQPSKWSRRAGLAGASGCDRARATCERSPDPVRVERLRGVRRREPVGGATPERLRDGRVVRDLNTIGVPRSEVLLAIVVKEAEISVGLICDSSIRRRIDPSIVFTQRPPSWTTIDGWTSRG